MTRQASISVPTAERPTRAVHDETALEDAMDYCRGVVRARARNFYYGLRISPEPERSAVFALYAWMREADDLTDSDRPVAERRAAVDAFWERTERTLRGPVEGEPPLWAAFGHVARHHGLDPEVLRDVIRGMHADLDAEERAAANGGEPVRICATRDDLLGYCDRVASTVGLCCVKIWGLRDEASEDEADRLAIARGRAFQLTNILRDFAEDFDAGRVYLPSDAFDRRGLTPAQLRAWDNPTACDAMLRELIGWAEGYYDESAPLAGLIREDHAPTLEAMSGIYRGLLAKIARDPSVVASGKRVRLSKVAKVAIALKSVRAARRLDD